MMDACCSFISELSLLLLYADQAGQSAQWYADHGQGGGVGGLNLLGAGQSGG